MCGAVGGWLAWQCLGGFCGEEEEEQQRQTTEQENLGAKEIHIGREEAEEWKQEGKGGES